LFWFGRFGLVWSGLFWFSVAKPGWWLMNGADDGSAFTCQLLRENRSQLNDWGGGSF
jgi:hypothetical protein